MLIVKFLKHIRMFAPAFDFSFFLTGGHIINDDCFLA